MNSVLNEVAVVETVSSPIEITSNITTVSLVDGSVAEKKEAKRKGRPAIHAFAGRIALLRDEVTAALQNGDAFIEQMQAAHKLDEQRQSDLIAAGLLDPTVDQFFYTFQGPVGMVLDELQAVQNKYQDKVDAGSCSIRFDFHKKKIISNEKNPLYVAPVTQRVGQDIITTQMEALPDVIYGYASVTLNK